MNQLPVVRDFMSRQVIVLSPDMMIYDAIKLLLDHRISGAPVVEPAENGHRVVGIISEHDCISTLTNGAFYGQTSAEVRDVMRSPVQTLTEDMGLFVAAERFLQTHFRRFPVVNAEELLVGIVSRADVLRASKELWVAPVAVAEYPFLTDEVKAKLRADGMPNLQQRKGF
jgi:CBS domain-containing protein